MSDSGASRKPASPISSASTPPGPKATSGPNIGSCVTPASSSAPALTIGWTTTGPPIRVAAACTASSSARPSTTPPVSDLCTPAAAVLTATGKPSSRAARGRLGRGLGSPLGDDRDAVGLEQRPATIGIEPDVVVRRERVIDERARRGAVDPRKRRSEADRSPQPLGALHGAPQRAHRSLGIGEARNGCERGRGAAGRQDTGEHRFPVGERSRRARSRPRPPPRRPRPAGRRARSPHRFQGRRGGAATRPRSSRRSPSRACRRGSRSLPRREAPRPGHSWWSPPAGGARALPRRRRRRRGFRVRPRW